MLKQKTSLIAVAGLAFTLAGCATTPTAEVTRFHLGGPIPNDSIRVVPAGAPPARGAAVPLEFQTYAAVVTQDLARLGFRPVPTGPVAYLAVLDIQQMTRAGMPQSSPFRIGIGGGTSSGNVGIGGGVNIPVGAPRNSDVRVNVLALRIRRESDDTAVWEGRAVQEIPASAQGSTLSAAVPALSGALLREFPGESGRTVIVKLR